MLNIDVGILQFTFRFLQFSCLSIFSMNTSHISEVLDIFYNNADDRIRDKIFMGSPYIIISIYLVYVLFIVKILPKFMENRKPLNYDVLMSSLDAILCVFACYFFLHALVGWMYFYNWACQPIDRSDIWLSNKEIKLAHEFLLSKFLYILQSIVFIICKKNSPFATYLLCHHTLFPIMLWFGINFYPGGHATFIGLINSFVHVNTTVMRFMAIKFPETGFRTYQRLIHVLLNVSTSQCPLELRHFTVNLFHRYFNTLPYFVIRRFYSSCMIVECQKF